MLHLTGVRGPGLADRGHWRVCGEKVSTSAQPGGHPPPPPAGSARGLQPGHPAKPGPGPGQAHSFGPDVYSGPRPPLIKLQAVNQHVHPHIQDTAGLVFSWAEEKACFQVTCKKQDFSFSPGSSKGLKENKQAYFSMSGHVHNQCTLPSCQPSHSDV